MASLMAEWRRKCPVQGRQATPRKGVRSSKRHINSYVCAAPWSVANRLHGQRTGAFSWLPVLRSFQDDRPIPARPYPELRIWKAMWSGVISVSPRTLEVLWHIPTCDQPPAPCPSCIPSTTYILVPSQPTIALTTYTHEPSVTNSFAIHA